MTLPISDGGWLDSHTTLVSRAQPVISSLLTDATSVAGLLLVLTTHSTVVLWIMCLWISIRILGDKSYNLQQPGSTDTTSRTLMSPRNQLFVGVLAISIS